MIHITEELVGIIENMATFNFDGVLRKRYTYGKVFMTKDDGEYWGVSIKDEGEKVGLFFYDYTQKKVADRAISYIKHWMETDQCQE